MEREIFNHGFSDETWELAKNQARKVMYEIASKKRTIAYSSLVDRIAAIHLDAHDPRLAHFLGQIAVEDDIDGKGLSTVVVVHKTGDQMPGFGFFEMAESQGRDTSDEVKCWANELNNVYKYWKN